VQSSSSSSSSSAAGQRRTLANSTLFERLAREGFPVMPLLTQYRCHPTLAALPSKLFYGGALRDGIHSGHAPPKFRLAPRLIFYDCSPPLPPGSPLEATLGELLRTRVGPAASGEARAERGGGGGGGQRQPHQ
jgi:hypothetical protein